MTDAPTIKIHVRLQVDKYDGEYEPGKEPAEVVIREYEEEVDYATYQRIQELDGERNGR